jgi:hypothetical protein
MNKPCVCTRTMRLSALATLRRDREQFRFPKKPYERFQDLNENLLIPGGLDFILCHFWAPLVEAVVAAANVASRTTESSTGKNTAVTKVTQKGATKRPTCIGEHR